ncbi:uncharacterized protein [Fopius arisanus]|uniref:Uncharacterized protein isoform X2 n=1 Tax=Fopius arisanus TaxID=64838 RepID=A0A9R1U1R9_9HYME|nr:PREDICTED: uncharacterized protein LOC105267692 isoform X2 [Fopius arisanus]
MERSMEAQMDQVSSLCGKKSLRKCRRRFERNLPTPPPDPISRLACSDDSLSTVAVGNVNDAFNHISKLYIVVEQMVEIRKRSCKLFNRVRQLERVIALKKANSELEKALSSGEDVPMSEEDVGFAESLLGAMLASNFEVSRRTSRASTSARRNREQRRVSCPIASSQPGTPTTSSLKPTTKNSLATVSVNYKKRPSLVMGLPKVSKWTRVKAAFKWERASCNTAEVLFAETDNPTKLLIIPENNAGSSEVSGPPTPAGTISSSSSIDDVFHRSRNGSGQRSRRERPEREGGREFDNSNPSRRSGSFHGETLVGMKLTYAQRGKQDPLSAGKNECRMSKTPWGKMKDIMALRRDSLGRQTSQNSRNEDNRSTSSLDSADIQRIEDGRVPRLRITSEPSGTSVHVMSNALKSNVKHKELKDLASRRLTPTLTITVPSSEELRSISSPESITPPLSVRADKFSPGCDIPTKKNEQISPGSSSSGILRYGLGKSKTSQAISADFKRQQSSKGDSLSSSPKIQRRNSKWSKVKRAFLTSATSVPTSPSRVSSYFFDDGEATAASYSASASAEDLDNDNAFSNPVVQAEIQRNYRLLNDKLGTEFYRKLGEWEKVKSVSPNRNCRQNDTLRLARVKDMDNVRLLTEEKLTPEFKKKLEEWKRMNKSGIPPEQRILSKRRLTDWQLWKSPSKTVSKPESPGKLSDDFVKKMEGWTKMKAAGRKSGLEHEVKGVETEAEEEAEEEAVDGGESKEDAHINELIDRTKFSERFKSWKGLEDDEFKSLGEVISIMERDQQNRLSKLHRVVGSPPEKTQEVLIHTSTGLYRFEGISRQFTKKLYEWEKSQGIAPECSTFRLLDPLRYGICSRPRLISTSIASEGKPLTGLKRSKSVGSVHMEGFCTREERSILTRLSSSLSLNDIGRLDTRSCIIGSVPTIPDDEDTSEDIVIEDSEQDPEAEVEPEAMIVDIEDVVEETASPMAKYQPHQTPVYSVAGSETTSIAIPLGTVTSSHQSSPAILIQPHEIHPISVTQACIIDQHIHENDHDELIRISQGTRNVAARATIKQDCEEVNEIVDGWFNELHSSDSLTSINGCQMAAHKSSMETGTVLPRNYNYNKTEEDGDAVTEVVITVASNSRHSRKYLKTRRLTDTQVGYGLHHIISSDEPELTNTQSTTQRINDFLQGSDREKIIINENTLNKIVVPTSSGTISMGDEVSVKLKLKKEQNSPPEQSGTKDKRNPASMFVKTKRIVFSPFRRDSRPTASKSSSPSATPESFSFPLDIAIPVALESLALTSQTKKIDVPQSPIPPRKEYSLSQASTKETAPSIRMMIKKYNAKVEASGGMGSATSSGSGSPIWRSPVSERRIATRMEKYEEEVRKAVAGPIYPPTNIASISKSSTIDFTKNPKADESINSLNLVIRSETAPQIPHSGIREFKNPEKDSSSASLRAIMIQKAKEEFLSRDTGKNQETRSSTIYNVNENKKTGNFNETAKRSKVVARAELVKSASVGMINIVPDAFERLHASDPFTSSRKCDSLPRSSDQLAQQIETCPKESRFHQLANKFRRAKLRRSKDKELVSMSTVSMLCRQSLFVDISNVGTSKSCPTTPSPQYDHHLDTV